MIINRRRLLSILGGSAILCPGQLLAAGSDLGVGFIFVGAGWCNTCKQAAPILAAFSASRGVPVLVATEDGRPIEPFPPVVAAAGHPLAGAIRTYPTTLVYAAAMEGLVGGFEGYGSATRYASNLSSLLHQAGSVG